MEYERLFEEILRKSKFSRLKEMARLGKLGDLDPGKAAPAYEKSKDGKKDILVGNPVIPECFKRLKELIPDSYWWWITSGSNLHNSKGSTAGLGSFQFRFMIMEYFLINGYYDPLIGFKRIRIGYDDIDTEVEDPSSITIEDIEDFVSSDLEGVINFILEKCRLNEKQLRNTSNLMKDNPEGGFHGG